MSETSSWNETQSPFFIWSNVVMMLLRESFIMSKFNLYTINCCLKKMFKLALCQAMAIELNQNSVSNVE